MIHEGAELMSGTPKETLKSFQEKVFAKHVLFDLPFPIIGTFLVVALNCWLLHGKIAVQWIAAWVLFTTATTCVRVWFEKRMRLKVSAGTGYATTLHAFSALSIPTGAISGMFAWMYFDANTPQTMVILSTYMTVVIVGSVIPTAVYLPAFYLLVAFAYGPYLFLLMQQGSTEHWVMVGVNALFLMVTFRYAHAANQMHHDAVRLRYENHQLIADLEVRKVAAEDASKTKSLFLAGVSHDLKQPIRAMGLYLGALQQTHDAVRASMFNEVVPKMEKTLNNLHAQVSRLLELSRLESGSLQVAKEPLDLFVLFARLQALFETQAHNKGLALHFANVKRLHNPVIWADKTLLESALQNFISNAIKNTEHGAVYVGVRVRKGYALGRQLCIEVRDSGSGIHPDKLAYLFDAYRSFDDRQASESHGLGLAIAKAQATYLGADITVRSAPYMGSVFTLCGLATQADHL
jgi:signal transduction histidine kinase